MLHPGFNAFVCIGLRSKKDSIQSLAILASLRLTSVQNCETLQRVMVWIAVFVGASGAAAGFSQAPDMTENSKKEHPGSVVAQQIVPRDAQSRDFVRGLIARGEAAKADADGKLPKGATHEIVGETEEGEPIVVRRRFSAF
jgi:hypothetical protein